MKKHCQQCQKARKQLAVFFMAFLLLNFFLKKQLGLPLSTIVEVALIPSVITACVGIWLKVSNRA
jgi:hypothetical protein